jgi:hypothetical protein
MHFIIFVLNIMHSLTRDRGTAKEVLSKKCAISINELAAPHGSLGKVIPR